MSVKDKIEKCYLEGCENPPDKELIAFCSQKHKDEFNKSRPPLENHKTKLSVDQMRLKLLEWAEEERQKKKDITPQELFANV